MNGLDLFSGIGGIGLALEPWVRTVAYCEQDRYAQSVLLSRMQSGEIDRAPIWDDVTTLRAELLPRVDIIFGGFPCQDLSVAGRGKGLAGERSGLFFEIVRLVQEIKPSFVFLENVPAIRTRGLSEVVHALTEIGYDCRWTCLSAADVGAPHKRERWFLLAHPYSNSIRIEQRGSFGENGQGAFIFGDDGSQESVAHSNSERSSAQSIGDVGELGKASEGEEKTRDQSSICFTPCGPEMAHAPGERVQGLRSSGQQEPGSHGETGLPLRKSERGIQTDWDVEPNVGRVVDGLPNRAHRIKCLGNSVVPLQVREAFKKLAGIN